jgi:hypothetical protein
VDVLFECATLDTIPYPREELIHYMMIMQLQKHPGGHFLSGEEMVQVGAVVVPTGIAFTALSERRSILGMFR